MIQYDIEEAVRVVLANLDECLINNDPALVEQDCFYISVIYKEKGNIAHMSNQELYDTLQYLAPKLPAMKECKLITLGIGNIIALTANRIEFINQLKLAAAN